MSRFGSLLRALGLASALTTVVGCHAIFGDFTIDDNAFIHPILLSPTKGLYTTEWGGQATFTIVLDRPPTENVTVGLSSSNINEGTVTPKSVTFTKDDWKAPQVVTVTGVDDRSPDRNQTYKIITAPAVSKDPVFNGKNPIDIELVNIDNETAGITVVPKAQLVTSESGGQDTFTVVLNSMPATNVDVSLTSDNPKEGTVAPASLVFTPVNWMAPQLVTVTGVDDGDKDKDKPYQIKVSAKSDDQNYGKLDPIFVDVLNQDNESAGLTVALVSGVDAIDPTKLRTSESGDSATFTVALNAPPRANVLIPVSIPLSGDLPAEAMVSTDSLAFTPDNWNAPQTVTVTGLNDNGTADGDQPYTIVLGVPSSDDLDYAALPETDVAAFNVDDDKPGFTFVAISGLDPQDETKSALLTTEARATATFSIALNSKPSDTVTVHLSSSVPSEGEVSPEVLTFTTDNWNSPHIVSVTGVGDNIQDGNQIYFVRTGAAESTDLGYNSLDPKDVQVTNLDDDSAGVFITLVNNKDPNNSARLVTDEFGSTATFTVALTSEPKADVSIPLTSTNTLEGTVLPATLTFTRVNYRAPQTVTITGKNDEAVDGNQPFSINVGPANSDDMNFSGKFASQVQVTNRDDDSAGVIVAPTSGLTTSENGTIASFTIRLQSKPADNVSIALASSNPLEGKPNVNSVTFTPVNWNANQTVNVIGQEDDQTADGNQSYKIIVSPPVSNGDPNYNGKPDPPDVSLTNLDNDSAFIIVTPTSGLVTKEDRSTATFTIALASKPSADATVKITLTSSLVSEGTVSPASVTFDAVNWKAPQTVTVTGVDDFVADGPQPYTIITTGGPSTDGNYNGLNPSDVSVTNVDNDSAGVQILPLPSATPTATTEKLGTATFSVALNSQPKNDVTFTVTSLDPSEGMVSPAMLKFTTANWKTPQVVTVAGLDDKSADGDQQYTVRLSNGVSMDSGYSGKFGIDLPFINLDDDHPGLDIIAAPSLKTSESGGTAGSATFTVALLSLPAGNVSVAVSSSDTGEGKVSPATLLFTQSNWSNPQTVTIEGVPDQVADGPQLYQVKLANAVSASDPDYDGKFGTQLEVQNTDVDQPGYTVNAGTLVTSETGGQAMFDVVLKSKPQEGTTVSLRLKNSNPKEGSVSPLLLTFTPADWSQPHPVTVTGVDDKKVDGPVDYQISFTADMDYGAPAPTPLVVTNTDDDVLGVLVTPTTCQTTPGTTATFTVRLNSQPSANVTISLLSDTPTAGSVPPDSALVFTTDSWNMLQTVIVTGGTDGTAGMPASYSIVTGNAVAPGETTGYDGFPMVSDVACTNQPAP